MNGEYGYRKEIKLTFNITLLSSDDLERLAQDAIRELLLTDRLNQERHARFRDYLASALDESA